HTRAATLPMATDDSGVTNPAAGVMATSPTTAATAAPTPEVLFVRTISSSTQVTTAAAADRLVVTKARLARPPAVSAEPALNPTQPNHNREAPRMTKGTLCGTLCSGLFCCGPRMTAATRADTPALMWTTDPPAKSSAPSSRSQPPAPHTQWAMGL